MRTRAGSTGVLRLDLAAFAAAAAIGLAAGWACLPDTGNAAPANLDDTIGVHHEITVRYRGRAPKSFARKLPMLVRRLSDGDVAGGLFERGRPILDDAGRRVTIVPWLIQDHFRRLGQNDNDASSNALRAIAKAERTGRLNALEQIDFEIRTHYGVGSGYGIFLNDAQTYAPFPPAGDGLSPELADLRAWLVGDDALWAQFVGGDTNAFTTLIGGDGGLRFAHEAGGTSSLGRLSHYHELFRPRRNELTFQPYLGNPDAETTVGLAPDSLYELRVLTGRRRALRSVITGGGKKLRFVKGVLRFKTPRAFDPYYYERHDGTDVPDRQGLRVVNVSPPNGETLVPLRRDWEDGTDQTDLHSGDTLSSGSELRLRFSEPLDPRSVDGGFYLTIAKAHVGTPDERHVSIAVPIGRTELQQIPRRGQVVTLKTNEELEPSAEYEIIARGTLRAMRTGEHLGVDRRFTFQTIPANAGDHEIAVEFTGEEFTGFDVDSSTWTAQWPAIPALDPDGRGLLAPNTTLRVSGATSGWFDTGRATPLYFRPELEDPGSGLVGTQMFVPDDGSTVLIEVRTAPLDLSFPFMASEILATTWVPLDEIATISDRRFIQFRVTFTLPDRNVGDPLPYVDRIGIGVRGDR